MKNIDNLFEEFLKFFPKIVNNINTNMNFETLLKLFNDKSNELIKDKQYVLNLIEIIMKIYII